MQENSEKINKKAKISKKKVKTEAMATRVIIEDNKATAVELVNHPKAIKARKEIILSAGSILSASLLLRSGVGPGEENKIQLPVGQNVKDQLILPLNFDTKSLKSTHDSVYFNFFIVCISFFRHLEERKCLFTREGEMPGAVVFPFPEIAIF